MLVGKLGVYPSVLVIRVGPCKVLNAGVQDAQGVRQVGKVMEEKDRLFYGERVTNAEELGPSFFLMCSWDSGKRDRVPCRATIPK